MHVFPANEWYKRGDILYERYIQIDWRQHESKCVHHNRRCRTGNKVATIKSQIEL